MPKLLSVIICTHNRKDYLRKAMDSLLYQDIADPNSLEMIVVDNASTDGTKALVDSYGDRFRYLHESRLGLSVARNSGLRQAEAPIVAFLDDDAIATPGWAREIVTAFNDQRFEKAGCIGGRVLPIWEIPRPPWLVDDLLIWLSMLDYGSDTMVLGLDKTLVGANMAFRTAVLRAVEGFPESLGRKGASLLSREESYVRERMLEAGYSCVYWPAIEVSHHAQANRINKAWFQKRIYWQGISQAVSHVHESRIGIVGRLLRFSHRAARAIMSDIANGLTIWFQPEAKREKWFFYRNQEWGRAMGYLHQNP